MSFLSQGFEVPFTNGAYNTRSKQFSAQRCVNYRPNIAPAGALSQQNLYQTEGIDGIIASLADSPCRGFHTMNGIPYAVIGDRLYRINRTVSPELVETWSTTDLGEVLGNNDVIMASGWSSTGYEMAIVSPGEQAYSYREATGVVSGLTGLTNFLSPVIDVINLNGFFIFLQEGTNIIFHSNLNNISTYNALDFELITRTPTVLALIKYRGQVYVMGDNETLPYTFIGGTNFVLQYQPNSTVQSGINNTQAKTTIRQSFCYLGGGENESPAVWLSTGQLPQKISTEAIEYQIRGTPLLDEARMYNFAIDGGEYVVLRFGDYCFVYDLLTGRWHERESRPADREIPWRASYITNAYGRLLVGDSIDGRIGSLSSSDTEYGDNVHRRFTLQPFDNKGKALRVSDIMVAMDAGFGGEMSMDYSDDGGYTWSDGLVRPAGESGEYGKHVAWDRLGAASFARTFRFGTSSGVKANVNKILAITYK